jgi:hypothetical protein
MTALNLFAARARFVNENGTLTTEAMRALQNLNSRVYGADAGTSEDFSQAFGGVSQQQASDADLLQGSVPPGEDPVAFQAPGPADVSQEMYQPWFRPFGLVDSPTFSGVIYRAAGSPTSKGVAATLTAAEMLVKRVRYTGAAANLTTPTGTDLAAAIFGGGLPFDYEFVFSIINTGSGTATLVANTDVTIVGSAAVAAGSSGLFAARKSAATTFIIYRDA